MKFSLLLIIVSVIVMSCSGKKSKDTSTGYDDTPSTYSSNDTSDAMAEAPVTTKRSRRRYGNPDQIEK